MPTSFPQGQGHLASCTFCSLAESTVFLSVDLLVFFPPNPNVKASMGSLALILQIDLKESADPKKKILKTLLQL